MIVIVCKAKYRIDRNPARLRQSGEYLYDITKPGRRSGQYRERTGPNCCNAGCGSGRRKGGRIIGKMAR